MAVRHRERRKTMEFRRGTVEVTLISHPQAGAQEWLGNTQHMFDELIDEVVQRFQDGARWQGLQLFVDETRTHLPYYWAPVAVSDTSKWLYGPVVVAVRDTFPALTRALAQSAAGDVETLDWPDRLEEHGTSW